MDNLSPLPEVIGPRRGKPSPGTQATALQLAISKLIKADGIAPSALAALSEQWLKLEQFKRSIRPPKSKRVSPAQPTPAKPTDGPHFTEPDDEPGSDEPAK